MAQKIKDDDSQRIITQVKSRFKHLDDTVPFVRTLMEEVIRQKLGQDRKPPQ